MDINLNGFSESGNSPRIDHRGGFGTVAQGAEAPSSAAGTSASGRSAFAVDFDPNRPTMGAYAEKKRSMQEIMDQAGAVDTKNLHNYMNLMANTVSAEDFARAAEEGYDFSEVEPEEAVTILDHIKAAVALSGQEIVGFTDGLSTNQLTQITGSAGMAEAIRSEFARQDLPVTEANVRDVSEAAGRLMELPPLSDGAVQYLTENAMTPTIDNLYLAQHSGAGVHRAARGYYAQETGGYYAQTAQETDWEQIAPQAEAVIEDAGYRTAAEKQRMAEEQAKWMVTAGVPLTAANLTQVMELRGLQLPSSMEAAVATATAARASGRPAASGEPGVTESDVRRAARYQEELNNVTDAAVEKAVRNGRPLTLKQLREAERESGNEAGQSGQQEATPEAMEAELLRARKQIEEARLSMSVEANLRLMEWGVKIDTTPMAELIDQLNRAITQIERGLFGTQAAQTADGSPVVETTLAASQGVQEEQQNGRLELFRTSMQRIGALADGPAAVSGAIAGFEMELTLEEIVRTSENVEKRLQTAGTAYESLMTAPRADLGDSIRKAFRNVDDILTDLGFELNDENRRAVRIMGYNHMAMTAEHIEAVRAADRRLTATVGELKPAAVLQLIRDGQDPMGMTLDELRQELSDRQQEENRSEEKYARFLYKLEQNDEITPEERESYIGIYRLFHNLKQTDDAAIGALLRTGAELTIGNLLTATRSNKVEGRGLDVRIDEDFAGLVAGKRRNTAIDDQIRTAFRTAQAQADIVYDHLEPEALHAAKPQEETSLPELAQALEQAETNAELERSYYAQEQMQWQHSFDARGAAAAAEELVRFDAALTAVNLEGMQRVRTDRSGRTNVWDEMARLAGHVFDEAKQELVETLGEAEDYRQGYTNRLDHIGDALTRMMMEETASRLDVAAIGLIRRQLTVTRRLAAQNSFEIPVEVDGQEVSMHVTMETDRTTRGRRISATLSTIDHGDLEMALTESGGQLTGLLTSSYGSEEEQRQFMEGVRRRLTEEIGRTVQGVQVEEQDIGILYRTTNAADKVTAGRGTLDDRSLLRLARAFIVSVG